VRNPIFQVKRSLFSFRFSLKMNMGVFNMHPVEEPSRNMNVSSNAATVTVERVSYVGANQVVAAAAPPRLNFTLPGHLDINAFINPWNRTSASFNGHDQAGGAASTPPTLSTIPDQVSSQQRRVQPLQLVYPTPEQQVQTHHTRNHTHTLINTPNNAQYGI
jgi:hypothetical protein